MRADYLVSTSGLLARKTVDKLVERVKLHEPYETYTTLRLLLVHLDTLRFHNEDAFIAAMDNVISVLGGRTVP